ncbi:MAG TPA: HEAT repeat domain-containing protein, partial [Thermoanaerobaculia bacterium]|nr:HEAT repeat domain-containing protein [Thermoanaerobaculia bacterium]
GLSHAQLRIASTQGNLANTISRLLSSEPAPSWIGWGEPLAGRRHMCCYDFADDVTHSPCGHCDLDDEHRKSAHVDSDCGNCGALDGAGRLLVFVRFEEKRASRIRTFSADCPIDAGDQSVVWINNVPPAESIAYLEKAVEGRGDHENFGGSALAAIAMHDDPSADAVLEKLVAPGSPEAVRRQATFWMGNARGRRGYETLKRLAQSDPSDELRKHVTFALSQSREPEAVDTLIGMARNDRAPEVRSQALFWLAQKAGKKGAAAIEDAIRDDPETEVKKKAVFALTQLPKDEGVPQLIRVARTNRNPAVRKQAFFWLGQSRDPRALAFFEEVLLK